MQQFIKDEKSNTSVFENAIRELVNWYINSDEAFKQLDEVKEIFNNDGQKITENVRYKIAMDIYFIADAYDDNQLFSFYEQILVITKKEEIITILMLIKERLINGNFNHLPISNNPRKGNLINVIN